MKILFLSVNPPTPNGPLRPDVEARAIDQSLRLSDIGRDFDIKHGWAVRVSDIQSLLLQHKPDVIHFSGHGVGEDGWVFQDENGGAQLVSKEALAELIAILKENVRCVVLNACFSVAQAELIREHVDFVVGMADKIHDKTSIAFAHAFYHALGYEGCDYAQAFALGRNQLRLENNDEAKAPKLFRRLDGPVPARVRDELIHLLDELLLAKPLDTADYKSLYHDCWPNAARLPAEYTAEIVIHNLADRGGFEDGWHPILELVERLARHKKCQKHAGKLTTWVDSLTAEDALLPVKRAVVEAHRDALNQAVEQSQKQVANRAANQVVATPYIFVIVMAHVDNVNVDPARRTYYLHVVFRGADGQEEIWHSDDAERRTAPAIYPALKKLFGPRVVPPAAHMEFFMPIDLLSLEIDRWQDWEDPDFVLFGTRSPVTVRFVDRLIDQSRLASCQSRWPTDAAFFEHEEFFFLAQEPADCRAKRLYSKLRTGKQTSVGVTLAASEMPKPADLFRALLALGIPVAVWSRYEAQLCERAKAAVHELVSHKALHALPQMAHKLRVAVNEADDEDPSHPGNHLILMVDDPNRRPQKLTASLFEPQMAG